MKHLLICLVAAEMNLVNRKTRRSIASRPMTLARGLHWVHPGAAFGGAHVVDEAFPPTRACETITSRQSAACFEKTDAYYSWEDGLPVSDPLACRPGTRCPAAAAWSVNATLRTNLLVLPIAKLRSLVTKGRAGSLASDLRSSPDAQIRFRGPNVKVLVFKALLYTIAGSLEVFDPAVSPVSSYYDLRLSFPVRLNGTDYADGVFYLDDG